MRLKAGVATYDNEVKVVLSLTHSAFFVLLLVALAGPSLEVGT